ncbi:MAG: hypothetical protein JW757_14190 [Anaerolineales bacterium]|nr:hypothetical protein [Anaerolineales bacterium]
MHRFRDDIAPARERASPDSAGFLCMGMAAVAAGSGQPERAARLWGAAQKFLGPPRDVLEAFDWTEFERHVDQARQQLGEQVFAVLSAEGAGLEMESAVAYALEVA